MVKQLTLGVQTCLSHLSPGVYEFGTNAASSAGLAGWASCCTRSHHPSHLARALILSLPLFRAMPLGRRRLLLPLSSAALAIIVRVLYSFFFRSFLRPHNVSHRRKLPRPKGAYGVLAKRQWDINIDMDVSTETYNHYNYAMPCFFPCSTSRQIFLV